MHFICIKEYKTIIHAHMYTSSDSIFLNFETIENGNDHNFLILSDIYLYIDLFALSWRRSVESNWRNSGQIHGQVFHGRCRSLFKIFPMKREIRKRYSFTWFSSRATSFDAHIEKRKGEKEWSLWKTNELNLYANAFIFYLEYEQSMDACRDPVVVAVSTPMHNERAAGYRDI